MRLRKLALGLMLLAPPAIRGASDEDGVRRISDRVDRALEACWKTNAIEPAELADDAEFFRRASLDLTGRIPSAADARAFLADKRPDKRRRAVDDMLAGPLHVRHLANLWREMLLPPGNNQQVAAWSGDLDAWLRSQFRRNVPYDRFARELLTPSLTFGPDQPTKRLTALPFYRANDLKPESLAASVSQVFLGISLDCAQCHNHPFAPWKQQQFAEFAAFFAGPKPTRTQAGRVVAATDSDEPKQFALPNREPVSAHFLDGAAPQWAKGRSPRSVLADWITAPSNPYFAKHAVNRMWGQLFGAELVADDDSPFKELLDELAHELIREKYDLRLVTAGLVASKAYQRTSASSLDGTAVRLFARSRVRGLSADQLCDNLVRAAGFREPFDAVKRIDFLARFQQIGERHSDRLTSVLQVLHLMNGSFVNEAVRLDRGPTLIAIAEAPWLDTAGRIEALYFATLSRPPRSQESARWVALVDRGSTQSDRRQALADVFWGLLNSSEFLFNH
jgi:hypothetical protein